MIGAPDQKKKVTFDKEIKLNVTNLIHTVMKENEVNLHSQITEALKIKFPDMKPKIAKVEANSFIYELEKHDNYTYFSVEYKLSANGILAIDWANAELTVI